MGKYAAMAQGCRMVALEMAHKAGKGHLGTSFSSADIMVAIRSLMAPADVFISSKGHDALMQYAVLAAWEILPADRLSTYRTEAGLPGHPTVDVPGIACNTGSLGMGLSKACGFVWAHRLLGVSGRVFVLLGDGEMDEGQNYEAMNFASRWNMKEILAVVDCNGWRQDEKASLNAAQIARRFQACGWAVEFAEGNADDLRKEFARKAGMPKCFIVETRKGQGVGFMEADPVRWHQGGPTDEEYHKAMEELT